LPKQTCPLALFGCHWVLDSGLLESSSPLTVAWPSRIYTWFPIIPIGTRI